MVRAIAIGRGRKESPHFNFLDIDRDESEYFLIHKFPEALIYRTEHGFHVIQNEPFEPEDYKLADTKCPSAAVRIYPNSDYKFIQSAGVLCRRVAGIYQCIFNVIVTAYPICCRHGQILKFGIYNRDSELHGVEHRVEQL